MPLCLLGTSAMSPPRCAIAALTFVVSVWTIAASTTSVTVFSSPVFTATFAVSQSTLVTTLRVSQSYAASFGVLASGRMVGPTVACYAGGGAASAVCVDANSFDLGITSATQVSTMQSVSVASGIATFTVSTPLSRLGISAGTTVRLMFAYSGFSGNLPTQHGNRAATSMSVAIPAAATITTTTTTTTTSPVPTSTVLHSSPAPPTTTSVTTPATTAATSSSSATSTSLPPSTSAPTTLAPQQSTTNAVSNSAAESIFSGSVTLKALFVVSGANLISTLTVSTSYAVSFALSTSGMIGPGVACFAAGGSAAAATCVDIDCTNYDVTRASPQVSSMTSVIVSSADGVVTFVVSTPLSRLGLTTASSSAAVRRRVIFTYSGFSHGLPLDHGPGIYASPTLSIPTSLTTAGSTTTAAPVATPSPTTASAGAVLLPAADSTVTGGSSSVVTVGLAATATTLTIRLGIAVGTAVTLGHCETGMAGPMVVCYAPSSDASAVLCVDIDGVNYGVSLTAAQVNAVSSSTSSQGTVTTIVTVPLSRFDLSIGSTARFAITSTGFSAANSVPLVHAQGAYGVYSAAVVQGTIYLSPLDIAMTHRVTAYTVAGCVLGGLMLAAAVLQCARGPTYYLPPGGVMASRVTAIAALIGTSIYVVIAARDDYATGGRTLPLGRAFGEVTMYLFALIFIPVCKYGPVLVGSSIERTAWVHSVLGVALLGVMTVHFGLMMGSSSAPDFTATSRDYVVTGVAAWACLVVMTVGAVVMRRYSFTAFRVTHLLFPAVIGLSIAHVPRMLAMVLPGLCVWGLDVVVRMVRGVATAARVESLTFHSDAGVVVLRLLMRWEQRAAAGSYVFLYVPQLSFIMHPFTIALQDPYRAEHGEPMMLVTLLIRATSADATNGRWSFTQRLAMIAKDCAGDVSQQSRFPFVLVVGPFGSLQTPLTADREVLMLGGGIGVTPLLGIIDHMASQHTASSSSFLSSSPKQHHTNHHQRSPAAVPPTRGASTSANPQKKPLQQAPATLLWVVRDGHLAALVLSLLTTRLALIPVDQLCVRVYVTKPNMSSSTSGRLPQTTTDRAARRGERGNSTATTQLLRPFLSRVTLHFGRPDMERELEAIHDTSPTVTCMPCFLCGPPSLMDAFQDAMRHVRGTCGLSYEVHQEHF